VTIKIVSLTRSSAVTDRTAQCAVLLNIFAVTLSVNSSDKRNLTLRRIIALERFLMLVGAKVLYCGTYYTCFITRDHRKIIFYNKTQTLHIINISESQLQIALA